MNVAPLLPTAVLELKTRVDSIRWLDKHYISGEEMVGKPSAGGGLYSRQVARIRK